MFRQWLGHCFRAVASDNRLYWLESKRSLRNICSVICKENTKIKEGPSVANLKKIDRPLKTQNKKRPGMGHS